MTLSELRNSLLNVLPDYMIPSYFVKLDRIPLTSNGKLDRRALPEPEGDIDAGSIYEPPQDEIEENIVSVWQSVLGIDRVGVKDNFF